MNLDLLPAPAPERPWHFPRVIASVLGNGVRTVLCPLPGHPLACLELVLDVGVRDEPDGLDGLATVLGDVLAAGVRPPAGDTAGDKASDTTSDTASDTALDLLGGAIVVTAEPGSVRVRLSCPSAAFPEGLAMLAEAVRRPRLDENLVGRLIDGRRQRGQRRDPGAARHAMTALRAELFGAGHRLGRPWEGGAETLERMAPGDVTRFTATHLHPSRAALVVAGDIGPDRFAAAVDRTLGGWRGSRAPASHRRAQAPVTAPRRLVTVRSTDGPQAELALGTVDTSPRPGAWPALLVGVHHLGGAQMSLLDLVLRERKGYTFGVRAAARLLPVGTLISVTATLRPDAAAAACADLLDTLDGVRRDGLSTEDLDGAIRSLCDTAPSQLQTARAVAAAYAQAIASGLPYRYPAALYEALRSVSVDDVNEALRRYLAPDRLALVVAGPADVVGPVAADSRLG
jgi:predicted Zn-dependent peptidase